MRVVVGLLFFVSGACGLVYEIAWARLLHEAFGATALAVGTVLAAFMAGLAAGAWALGRQGDRTVNPLRLYGLLEIAVSGAALAALLLLDQAIAVNVRVHDLLGQWPVAYGLARFFVAFALVAAPTFLMGATLPILGRFVLRSAGRIGAELGTLYAINTLGAVAGSVLAGFVLIGRLGVHGAVYVAAAANLMVGVGAVLLSGRTRTSAPPSEERAARGPRVRLAPQQRSVLALIFVSGIASFGYEVLWTRALVFLFGNSTYALTVMLVACLSGIALGGWAVRWIADRAASPLLVLGWVEVGIGVASAAAVPVLLGVTGSETLRWLVIEKSGGVLPLIASHFAIAFVVLLVPAALVGATFPLAGKVFVRDLRETSANVAKVYALNTIGNVVGALLPGVFLLAVLGVQRGILAFAALNVTLGAWAISVVALPPARVATRRAVPLVVGAAVAVLAGVAPVSRFEARDERPGDSVLHYREGVSATTQVFAPKQGGEKYMSIDGIVIGGTGFIDFKQQMLAHLPKLLVGSYASELSVGLGSGILVGESARHPELRRVVCAEIEPAVAEGAALFAAENHGILRDPRLELVLDDVSHYLRTTRESFDLVSADEKTADNYASNGFSYSSDYYTLLRDHLTSDGVVAQWVPLHLPPSAYRMILRTFTSVFPHVSLWYFPPVRRTGQFDTFLVGSMRPLRLDATRVAARLDASPAFDGLRKHGIATAEALLSHWVAADDVLRDAVRDAPENSLEHPRYEFYAPSDYAPSGMDRALANHAFLTELRRRSERTAAFVESAPEARDRLDAAFAAEEHLQTAAAAFYGGAPVAQVMQQLDRAQAAGLSNERIRLEAATLHAAIAERFRADGRAAPERWFLEQARQLGWE